VDLAIEEVDHSALKSLNALRLTYTAFESAASLLSKTLDIPLCVQCGVCCQQNVPVAYGIEAAFALSVVLGQGKLDSVIDCTRSWMLDQHSQSPTKKNLILDQVGSGMEGKLQDEFLALAATQCPFLEDKECSIHDARPLVCRAMGVTRTPSPRCKRPVGKGETPTSRDYIPTEAQNALKYLINKSLESVPKPTWSMAGFLPSLIFGLARPNEYQQMVQRGLVSTAKLVVTSPSMGILWQEQVEALVEKDMVAPGGKL